MQRPVRLFTALVAASLASAALAEDAKPPATIYRWVDQNGIAHYTTDPERVPESLRGKLPLRSTVSNPLLSAQAPASVDSWIAQDRAPEPAAAGAGATGGVDTAATSRLAALDARIAELEAAISADEDLLKGQLTDPSPPASNDALKQVSARMPARLEELRKLRAEREALAPAPSPAPAPAE